MAGKALDYAPYEAYSRPPTTPVVVLKKLTRWGKVKRWFRAVFCCCLERQAVEVEDTKKTDSPVPGTLNSLPVLDPEDEAATNSAENGMYMTPGGMVVWNPNSGTPCPHLLKTQNPRTGESNCCHCKAVL